MLLTPTHEAVRRHQLREEALFVPLPAVLHARRQVWRQRSLHARGAHRAVELRYWVLIEPPTCRCLFEGCGRRVAKMLASHLAALALPDEHVDVLDVLLGHESADRFVVARDGHCRSGLAAEGGAMAGTHL